MGLKLLTRTGNARTIVPMLVHLTLRTGLLLFCSVLLAQDTEYPASGQVIPGPAQPADFEKWLKDQEAANR